MAPQLTWLPGHLIAAEASGAHSFPPGSHAPSPRPLRASPPCRPPQAVLLLVISPQPGGVQLPRSDCSFLSSLPHFLAFCFGITFCTNFCCHMANCPKTLAYISRYLCGCKAEGLHWGWLSRAAPVVPGSVPHYHWQLSLGLVVDRPGWHPSHA